MFFLKKVFQLRDHANPDSEKPFLEHLEDMRDMIIRMVITLAVSVAACFVFQDDLMTILRHPVEQVRTLQQFRPLLAPLVADTVMDRYSQHLAAVRDHSLDLRRYYRKVQY